MMDTDSGPQGAAGVPPEAYPTGQAPASPDLIALLRCRMAAGGALDFRDFMAEALYHPDWGYYARGTCQVGRGGDFFTSVSVGPVFGELLARRFANWWQAAGRPAPWRVIECGAHDGILARDILRELRRLAPEALGALDYAICEPLPRLRAAQQSTLADFPQTVTIHEEPASLARQPLPGILFGNEVLDAVPCHRVEKHADGWHLLRVGHDSERGFQWQMGEIINAPRAANPDLAAMAAELEPLGAGYPDGYRTEVRTIPQWRGFLAPLLAGLRRGRMLWIDYGYAAPDYYHPARTDGTLRAFSRHRVVANPLVAPGEADLTAHVEFTAFAHAAEALGALPCAFRHQGAWLVDLARPRLLAMEGAPDPDWIRKFQTLVHPGHLGTHFQVIECSWREDPAATLPAADRHRLAPQRTATGASHASRGPAEDPQSSERS